ncbi:MAG: GNAT family N-acetyltransferase [Odoribacter sp.]|nr:GNAT family N-acetyltransferase [Odoribacter sp.]
MARPANIRYVLPSERNDGLLNRLTVLWEASVRATHHFLQEADIQNLKPYVMEGLANIRHLYVVSDTDAPVAFIGIQDEKIEMLFVSPRHLRKGIGRQLVDTAIKNHQAIFVDVNEQNPEARAFYEKLGFVEFGRTDADSQGNPFPIIELRQKEFY